MINSGHGILNTKITLVQGIIKYIDNKRRAQLPTGHREYRPMHQGAEYMESEHQVNKCMGKMSWFKPKEKQDRNWRDELKGIWKGSAPIQRPVKGL